MVIGLLINNGDVRAINGDLGGTEGVEAEDELGGVVGEDFELAGEALEVASHDADGGTDVERGGLDGDRGVGIAYHVHEHLHLMVGDGGEGFTGIGILCAAVVDHKMGEIEGGDGTEGGIVEKCLAAVFGAMDEDVARDDKALDDALAVA